MATLFGAKGVVILLKGDTIREKGVALLQSRFILSIWIRSQIIRHLPFAAITSKMKIIWNKIEHKKNIATPFFTDNTHRALSPNVILAFFFFLSGRLERKHSRTLGLSLCQSVRLINVASLSDFGWFSSYTGSFSRKAVKWGDSGKAERTVRRKVDL